MDPTSAPVNPAELYELLGIVGGVVVSGLLGFLLVRARAAPRRQRMIDAVGEAPAPRLREPRAPGARAPRGARGARPKPSPRRAARRPAPAPGARASPRQRPRARAEPAPAPRPSPSAPPAQVIPFPAPAPARKGAALAPGLARTRSGFIARLGEIFAGKKQIDPSVVDEIEKVLLTADIGVRTSQKLLEEIRSSLSRRELADPDAVWAFLRRRATEMLSLPAARRRLRRRAQPFVLLIIGVNGSGKTTTIGKLAAQLAADGKKVLLAAGDTFRAAAVEQLDVWADARGDDAGARQGGRRSVVGHLRRRQARARPKASTSSIADTAGRLHTKTDLMQELQKVRRVVGKAQPGRAARDLAGHRFDQRPERDRAGEDLHGGDGGDRVSCSPSWMAPPRAASSWESPTS